MLNIISYEGKTKEEVLEKALVELGLNKNDVFVSDEEIPGKLFSGKKVKVNILTKEEIKNFIKDYINNLSYFMNISINCEIREKENIFTVTLVTNNNPIIIGKDGRTLNAIQVLIRQALYNSSRIAIKVNLDASGYKEKRQRHLEYDVKRIAKEVLATKITATLDPMNSYERRIIHSLISEFNNLETESIGEGTERHITIKYKED